jgi:hypothetical protein
LYLNEVAEVMTKQQQQQLLCGDDSIPDADGNRIDQPLYHHHQLVLRHKTSYHLLSSGEFDCVGLHYTNTIAPRFAENQWWCLSSYIAKLPILTYETSGKEEPVYWLLASGHRVHSLETSPVRSNRMGSSWNSSSSYDDSEAFHHCLHILR